MPGGGSGTEIPEIYDPETGMWHELTNEEAMTDEIADEYPFMFLLPDGKVFFAGGGDGLEANPDTRTFTLDVQNEVWAEFPQNSNSFFRGNVGAAVMYEPGKILKAGGVDASNQPIDLVARIEIDPNGPEAWELLPPSSSLPEARKDHHLVLLPDGKILLVGGHDGTDYIKDARMFDPNAAILEWVDMADMVKARGHHGVALLLPDATVLSAGGATSPDPATAEIYRPPYLFAGPRPVIAPPPSSVQYGCQFLVTATPIGDIQRVTLVRPAAVTHWFDQDQRFLELTFTVVGDELLVDAPANANLAPPGYYMLFVINNAKVPSVAEWIRFPNDCPADLDGDNMVGAEDLAILLSAWGPNPGHPADLSCDGVVEAFDLAILLGAWGVCSGRGISSGTELIDALVEMGYANVAEHTAWSTAAPTEDALASAQQLLELLGE